jgi:signal peptidase I
MQPGFSLMAYFELILTLAVIFSGLVFLSDVMYFEKKRTTNQVTKVPKIIEYARSFFWVLFAVLCIRSFFFEGFRIPSGSLKPTLLVGDFIAVNKFTYGIRLPVLHTKIIKINEPQKGDIVVFRSVSDPNMDLVKRIIAVPGDRISYLNKILYINGKAMPQTFVADATDNNGNPDESWPVTEKSETLVGIKHDIFVRPNVNLSGDFQNILIPKDSFFAMGDNRDDSNDSRFWGFVPEANIIGRAQYILFSWNADQNTLRSHRFFKRII